MSSIKLTATIARSGRVFDGGNERLYGLQNIILIAFRKIPDNLDEKIAKARLNLLMRLSSFFRQFKHKGSGVGGGWFLGQKPFDNQGIQKPGGGAFLHGQKNIQIGNPQFIVFYNGIQNDILVKGDASTKGSILSAAARCLCKSAKDVHHF